MRLDSFTRLLVVGSVGAFGVASCGSERAGFGDAGAGNEGVGSFVEAGTASCAGLECKRVSCEPGKTTTLKGKVYDPAGASPLYNVIVYIPGGADPMGPLPPFDNAMEKGVACSPCSSGVLNPLASALTDTNGEFVLENVPVAIDVPVVIQIGKWRRRFSIDITESCAENLVRDKKLMLPKHGGQGDMPQIAVTTGALDALECLLRGIGIDDREFVPGHAETGHVHVFNGGGGDYMGKYAGAPTAEAELWNSTAALKRYDMALFSCEGAEWSVNKGGAVGGRAALPDYLDAGGRVFATHYHYTWFADSPSAGLRSVATYQNSVIGASGVHDINMDFPKGEAFAMWLQSVGASTDLGKIDLFDVRDTVATVNAPATSWITAPATGVARYFSFNTPVGAQPAAQCGRAVFSDLHITGMIGPEHISGCSIEAGKLTGQQRALEFFFFDLSACVSDDKLAPVQPR